jgi:trans-resveratrol di-O-methyltransferase
MELTSVLNLSLTYVNSYALRCAVELDIADHIQAYGRPMPLNELGRAIPIPPAKDVMLDRLMGLLVHKGVFAQNEAGYVLTPISKLGLTSEGSNLGAMVRLHTEPEINEHIMRNMSKWFKDGGEGTVFTKEYGRHLWEILREKPEIGNLNEKLISINPCAHSP